MTAQAVGLSVDLDEARRFIERVFGDTPPGYLSVCHTATNAFPSIAVPTIDGAVNAIERAERGHPDGIYLRCTTMTAAPARGTRGGETDTRALVGLWSDIDFGTVGHKPSATGRPNPPNKEEAARIVNTSGLPTPSLWVHSGGGLYAWWLLDEPLELTDQLRPVAKRLSSRWQEILGESAERLGYDYGTGVGDLSRVLRVPGTINRKAGRERSCFILQDTGVVYSFDELLAAVPAPTAPPASVAAPAGRPIAPSGTVSAMPVLLGGHKPGTSAFDLLDQHATFGDILTGAGWAIHGGRHPAAVAQCFTRPGNPEHDCSAHTLTANPYVLVVHSEAAGLPTGGGQRLTRGRVFAHLHHNGDERAASLDLFAAMNGRPCTPAAAALPLPRNTPEPMRNVGDLYKLETPSGTTAPTKADQPQTDPEPPVFDHEREEFWTARTHLDQLRQFARSRLASPWAVLGVALARVTAHVEPHLVLPPIVGGEVGLNLFVAVTGPSGGGKGAATATARDAIHFGDFIRLVEPNVGSGEGIVHTYMRRTKGTDGDPAGTEQHTTRALFHASEIDTLAALKGRQGSTLLPVLRDAWMSDRLGFQNADPARRLLLEPHTYRLSLIVGVQPARAAVLLDDADGGTPQRFLWMPSTDPGIPDQRPAEPARIEWAPPNPRNHIVTPSTGRYRLHICDQARHDIEQAARARVAGNTDTLDGHALLNRLKTAAALALLDGRAEVRDDDWQLAGTVLEISDHTRAQVQTTLQTEAARTARARGYADALRSIQSDDLKTEHATKRVGRFIQNKLTPEWVGHSVLRKKLASRDKEHFEDAINRLHNAGVIDIDDTGTPTRYRLARGSK